MITMLQQHGDGASQQPGGHPRDHHLEAMKSANKIIRDHISQFFSRRTRITRRSLPVKTRSRSADLTAPGSAVRNLHL